MPSGNGGDRQSPTPRASRPSAQGDAFGGVGDRMVALVLDRLLLAAVLLIPAAALGGNRVELSNRMPALPWAVTAFLAGGFVIVFLYHFLLESLLDTTPGKAILGLYVRNESERGTMATSAIRNAMRVADSLGLYLVGFLVALFSPRKQRLGDYVASTVVLERRMNWPARLALIVMWLAIVAASIWFAGLICPTCFAVPARGAG